MTRMTDKTLPPDIEVYQVGARRLYAKTSGGTFAIFEDELTPEELMAIAKDIAAHRSTVSSMDLACVSSEPLL